MPLPLSDAPLSQEEFAALQARLQLYSSQQTMSGGQYSVPSAPLTPYAYPPPAGTQYLGHTETPELHIPRTEGQRLGSTGQNDTFSTPNGGNTPIVIYDVLSSATRPQLLAMSPVYQDLDTQYQDLRVENAKLQGEIKGLLSSTSHRTANESSPTSLPTALLMPSCHPDIPGYAFDGINSQALQLEIEAAHAADPDAPSLWNMFWFRGDRWAKEAPKKKKKSPTKAPDQKGKAKAAVASNDEESSGSEESAAEESDDDDAEDAAVASAPKRGRAQMGKGKNVHCFYLVDRWEKTMSGVTLKEVFTTQNLIWEYYIEVGVLPDKFGDMSKSPRVMQDYIGRMRSAWIVFCYCAGDWKVIEIGEYRFNTFLNNKKSSKSADRRYRLAESRARYAFQGQRNMLYKLEAENEDAQPSQKRSKTEPVPEPVVTLSQPTVKNVATTHADPTTTTDSSESATSTQSSPSPVPYDFTLSVGEGATAAMEVDDPAPVASRDAHYNSLPAAGPAHETPIDPRMGTSILPFIGGDQSGSVVTPETIPATSSAPATPAMATSSQKGASLTVVQRRAKQAAAFAAHKGNLPDLGADREQQIASRAISGSQMPQAETKPKAEGGRSWNPGAGDTQKAILGHEWKAIEGNAKGTLAQFEAYCNELGEEEVVAWEKRVRADPAAMDRLRIRMEAAASKKANKASKKAVIPAMPTSSTGGM